MTLRDLREAPSREENERRLAEIRAADARRWAAFRKSFGEGFRLFVIITLAILAALQIQGWLIAEGLRNILGS